MSEGNMYLPEEDCAPDDEPIFIPALAHASTILGAALFLPVIIRLFFGRYELTVRRHCAEAFDFQVTAILAVAVVQMLSMLTSGLTYLSAGLSALILPITATAFLYAAIKTIQTLRQVPFSYPPSIRIARSLESALMRREVV